jgi:hypothetical protein
MENKSILGNLFNSYGELLRHLAEYGTLTDDEIIKRSTSPYGGIDVEECLFIMLERDFCKGANENIVKQLKNIRT